MAFQTTIEQLLGQANYLRIKYDTTGNKVYKEEENRIRRIVVDLQAIELGATSLDELSDVTISSPTNNQHLIYNGTTSQWENQTYNPPGDGLWSQTATSTPITNTIVETSLINGGVGTLTVPANSFAVGNSYVAMFSGFISNLNNATIRLRIKTDSVQLVDTGLITLPSTTNKNWELQINFVIRQIGGPGTASVFTSGRFYYNKDAGNIPESIGFRNSDNTLFNTTISNTLEVTAQWGSSSESNSISTDIFNLYKIY